MLVGHELAHQGFTEGSSLWCSLRTLRIHGPVSARLVDFGLCLTI